MGKAIVIFVLSVVLQLSTSGPIDSIIEPFIVGGEQADIADFPHQLALFDTLRGSICGASIIHRVWALSAAHCLQHNTPAALINLWGGSSSRLTGGHLFFAQQYVLHPSYNSATLDFDIAVVEVHSGTPLEGWPNVSPIALSPSCATDCCDVCAEGNNAFVTGWGRIDDGSLPEFLQQVSKPIMSNAECSPFWGGSITTRMICTVVEDGRDSCNGDSGSAIVRDGVQVGLVAFGSSVCGDGSRPAVYTRIEEPVVRSFIFEHTGV